MRYPLMIAAVAVTLAACAPSTADESARADPDPPPPTDPTPEPDDAGAIAFDVLTLETPEAVPDGFDFTDHAIEVARDDDELAGLWFRWGLEGSPPEIDTDERVVAAFVYPGNSCPDELVEAVVDDTVEPARLATTWLADGFGCNDIGLSWISVVSLHRGDLPEAIELTKELREETASVVVDLGTYLGDGSGGPPPDIPRPLTDAERQELIDASGLTACSDVPEVGTEPTVDGPLSDDEEVARAQTLRAGFALASDEATVRQLMDADLDTTWSFPVTPEEDTELMERNRLDIVSDLHGTYLPEHGADHLGYTLFDQAGGGRLVIGVTDDVEGHTERLAERWGDAVQVVPAARSQDELHAAVDALRDESWPEDLRAGFGATATHVSISLLDPDPDDIAWLRERVDPELTCLSIGSHGIPPDDDEAGDEMTGL